MNNQELFKDQYGNGSQQGGQRKPEGSGPDVVAVHRGLTGPDTVRLHIDHIVARLRRLPAELLLRDRDIRRDAPGRDDEVPVLLREDAPAAYPIVRHRKNHLIHSSFQYMR